jgi:hypothetical protein
MFVFGIVKSQSPTYASVARPALERVLEADGEVVLREGSRSIAASYNSILDECVQRFPSAEAVVLMHQDVEITSPEFLSQIRGRLKDPSIGLIGTIGAQNVRSLVYWRATTRGYVQESGRTLDFGRASCDVDAVDGMVLVLAPATFLNVRFDESVCRGFHGYDIDLGFAVRAAGLRVVVEPLPIVHHTKGGYGDRATYIATSRAWRRKWLSDAPVSVKLASWNDELQVLSQREKIGFRTALRRLLR